MIIEIEGPVGNLVKTEELSPSQKVVAYLAGLDWQDGSAFFEYVDHRNIHKDGFRFSIKQFDFKDFYLLFPPDAPQELVARIPGELESLANAYSQLAKETEYRDMRISKKSSGLARVVATALGHFKKS